MNTTPLAPDQALAEYDRIRDQARQRAVALRREAIDAFLVDLGTAARRAAARLLARKARHQRLRSSMEG